MGLLLVVVFIVVPVVELYVIVQVGGQIGVLNTIGLLILMSLVGSWLMRREGAKAWRAFRDATESGRVPAKEVADGFLVLLGGALLITPGFVSDLLGLVLLLPPTRALVRRSAVKIVMSRFTVVSVARDVHRRRADARIVEGEAVRGRETGPRPGGEGRDPVSGEELGA